MAWPFSSATRSESWQAASSTAVAWATHHGDVAGGLGGAGVVRAEKNPSDETLHNVHALADINQEFNIGQPKAGETVVVAAASGAVGAVVGQIAKLQGCRVVGIAGGADKCRFVVDELGFDACLDRRASDFPDQLAVACPRGIDVYFENVGGAVFDAVLPLLNTHARVPVCGLISLYSGGGASTHSDRLPALTRTLLVKRIRMQGFIIFDYEGRQAEFLGPMRQWLAEGKVKFREDIVEGLENAPQAFIGLLKGRNFGKQLVKLI
jgi:NADPH-dependent curcumin reductase CurA